MFKLNDSLINKINEVLALGTISNGAMALNIGTNYGCDYCGGCTGCSGSCTGCNGCTGTTRC